ncbi:response regulator transcription factor [Alteromonas sp. CYL-A6]|uniref:response regulator transcription factor n=1 Tax=Alteromonas nitratireducens TaxID=3390813 RepID=UPI0034BAF1E0
MMHNAAGVNDKKQPLSTSADVALVHLIDDDALMLDTVGMILDSVGIVHKDYVNADAFLNAYPKDAFSTMAGCVVCDIRMPGISGMECQRILNQYESVLPVIFMTGFADVRMAVDAMHEGAFDFVEKPFRDQTLIDTVQRALTHNAEVLQKRQSEQKVREALSTLSPREKDVMTLMLDGLPNKKISTTLNISLRTVEVHRAHVLEKMAARNVTELVKMVLSVSSD